MLLNIKVPVKFFILIVVAFPGCNLLVSLYFFHGFHRKIKRHIYFVLVSVTFQIYVNICGLYVKDKSKNKWIVYLIF